MAGDDVKISRPTSARVFVMPMQQQGASLERLSDRIDLGELRAQSEVVKEHVNLQLSALEAELAHLVNLSSSEGPGRDKALANAATFIESMKTLIERLAPSQASLTL